MIYATLTRKNKITSTYNQVNLISATLSTKNKITSTYREISSPVADVSISGGNLLEEDGLFFLLQEDGTSLFIFE